MLVSIVSSYYNREKFVYESIKSLLNQTYENIEIIVFDDGSTDSTYLRLKSFNDPRLIVLRHENQGFVKSIKKAIELSKGKLISIHGAGDISYPTAIEEQVKIIKAFPNVGVVGCHYELKDLVRNQTRVRRTYISPTADMRLLLQKQNPMTHGGVLFRKDIYEQVGGYREFFRYAQDRDLWLRMSLVTQFEIIPKVLQTRLVLPDGVNNMIEKRIIQTQLSKIAIQCQKMRLMGEEDIVDKYGEFAFCFAERSSITAFTLFKLSIRSFMDENLYDAQYLNKLSINEKKRYYNAIWQLILRVLSSSKLLTKIMLDFIGHIVRIKNKK